MRILSYLKGTNSLGVLFVKNGYLELMAYKDANWAGDRDSRKSTSWYFALVGSNLFTWRSKKKKVLSPSSVEVEFKGIAKGITKILWLRKL